MKDFAPSEVERGELCSGIADAIKIRVLCQYDDAGPFPLLTIESPNGKDDITILFAGDLVVQVGFFIAEVQAKPGEEIQAIVNLIAKMASIGYHARKGLFGTTSRLGPAKPNARGVLTNAHHWPAG